VERVKNNTSIVLSLVAAALIITGTIFAFYIGDSDMIPFMQNLGLDLHSNSIFFQITIWSVFFLIAMIFYAFSEIIEQLTIGNIKRDQIYNLLHYNTNCPAMEGKHGGSSNYEELSTWTCPKCGRINIIDDDECKSCGLTKTGVKQ
jgi:hypothetical protein